MEVQKNINLKSIQKTKYSLNQKIRSIILESYLTINPYTLKRAFSHEDISKIVEAETGRKYTRQNIHLIIKKYDMYSIYAKVYRKGLEMALTGE